MRRLKPFFLVTDIGFILYWIVTLLQVIPAEYLFQDYTNSILVSWNWSFLPLDLFISGSGLLSLYLHKREDIRWRPLAFVSLVLTFCSGLQAISFWMLRRDFDMAWWIPNLYLLIYPLFFIPGFLSKWPARDQEIRNRHPGGEKVEMPPVEQDRAG